jgi:hypothetical protein
MADQNRTERRLLDSIRKAKASSESGEASPAAESPGPRHAPATRTRSRPVATTGRVGETEARPSPLAPETENYQAGKRVWPD